MNHAVINDILTAMKGERAGVREQFAPAVTLGGTHARDIRLTMDSRLEEAGCYGMLEGGAFDFSAGFSDHLNVDGIRGGTFPGYHILSLLEQNPLIRIIVETVARESTRRWVALTGSNVDRVRAIENELSGIDVRGLFSSVAETTGYMGGCMLYIDMGLTDDDEYCLPLVLKPGTVSKGSFKGLVKIEPVNVYPAPYNVTNPLSPTYFEPEYYYINKIPVHKSRLIKFCSNVPNIMLKPAYNFFGIPLSQLMLGYVSNFERARDASVNIVDNFSLLGLKTNLNQLLNSGLDGADPQKIADDIIYRIKVMLSGKRNYGVALMDKEEEEFFQINTPLNGLEGLVAQQLELLALISREPVTKLFGTPPKGFNATGEIDRSNWYDSVRNYQELLFYRNFEIVRRVTELSLYGDLDSDIQAVWPPLKEPDDEEQAQISLVNARRDEVLVNSGVITPIEARRRIKSDPKSGYNLE